MAGIQQKHRQYQKQIINTDNIKKITGTQPIAGKSQKHRQYQEHHRSTDIIRNTTVKQIISGTPQKNRQYQEHHRNTDNDIVCVPVVFLILSVFLWCS
jgi:hypothetical protein